MKSLVPRNTLHRATALSLANASPSTTSDPPQTVTDWLARLSLLYGVPFQYLVPDYRMLPPESIRWGFLDENWVARASDGALSIGRTSSVVASLDPTLAAALAEKVVLARGQVRAELRGAAPPTDVSANGTLTVMLIRSAIVSGYPGMEVRGLYENGDNIDLLRMDQLAPDVLIVIFADLPATVELLEPPEGLHFGVRWNSQKTAITTLLRSLQSATLGQQVLDGSGDPVAVNLAFRAGAPTGVLDITQSMQSIVAGLTQYNGYSGSTLAPADMAIEMVRAAGLQRFVPGISSASSEESSS